MTKVLILGAGGKVAHHVIERLKDNKSVALTLYLRDSSRLKGQDIGKSKVIEGDILDTKTLGRAMEGQDLVYVNINGNEDTLTSCIVEVMHPMRIKRLIFIAATGVYNEVSGPFGQWNQQMIGSILERYKKAVALIERSGLDYTILRPTWYTDRDEIAYTISQKGDPVTGTEISRKSVADLIVKIIENPTLHIRESLGMEKPGTKGDKPSFIK